ncbi:hypothetical protein [Clostridium sp. BJN0013]|uniref:hypothetical protein n=1 Tax=Clostridium sp. BJN0013 TaxID=3236840 RepID=UPI0034C5B708
MNLKYTSIIITFLLSVACYFILHRFLNTAVISIVGAAVIMMMMGKINNEDIPSNQET